MSIVQKKIDSNKYQKQWFSKLKRYHGGGIYLCTPVSPWRPSKYSGMLLKINEKNYTALPIFNKCIGIMTKHSTDPYAYYIPIVKLDLNNTQVEMLYSEDPVVRKMLWETIKELILELL